MSNDSKNAVTYARVSTKKQEAEGYSISAQSKSHKKYASQKGLFPVQEFIEIESAKQTGRHAFEAMVQLIKTDKSIKHIVVDATDRLLRNYNDLSIINDLIEDHGIYVHLVKDEYIIHKGSSPAEKRLFGISAVSSKSTIDTLKEETKKGMLEKAEQGTYPSFAPYGYINCAQNGKQVIKPDPGTAPYVRKIFELYASGRYSLSTLRDLMVAEGMVYRSGKPIHPSQIENILKNEFYRGIFYWKGKRYDHADHGPLVSKEIFALVQKILRRPNKQKSRKDLFAYTNLLKCDHCGASITAEIKKEYYIYYHCTGSKGECPKKNIPESIIEEKIDTLLGSLHVTNEFQHTIHAAIKECTQEEMAYHTFNVERMEIQIQTLQNRIDRSYADMLDGKITEGFWLKKRNEWEAQKKEFTTKLLEYQKTNGNCFEKTGRIQDLTKRAPQIFRRGTVEQKRKIANLLFSTGTVRGKEVELDVQQPFNLILNAPSPEAKAP